MMSVENPTGRLLQIVVTSPLSVADVEKFMQELPPYFRKVGGKAIFVVDLRGANVFPAPVAERLKALLQSDNAAVLKSAYLMKQSAVFGMQVGRLIREANNPARQAFSEPAALVKFLTDELRPQEASAVQAFFARAAA